MQPFYVVLGACQHAVSSYHIPLNRIRLQSLHVTGFRVRDQMTWLVKLDGCYHNSHVKRQRINGNQKGKLGA